jgi:hypothetical protein
MRNRTTGVLLTLILACLASAVLVAATPTFWTVSTHSDLLRGDVENLSIDSHGRLILGPATELVYESAAPFLWAMVQASDGSTLVGSGNEGKVFRIDSGGKASVFFDASELEVHALAFAPDGALYVGTSPDGKIYKVDRSGTGTTFFDPEDKYIWSLAVDSTGNVFAATGEKGIVYKIAPDGKGAPFYRTRTTHAVALGFDKDGRLLVGTGSPGKLFRVDRDGKGFVLLDSPFQEIHSIRLDPAGVIYAAAVAAKDSTEDQPAMDRPSGEPSRSSTPVATVTTEVTSMSIVDLSAPSIQSGPAPREDQRSPKGAVYRVNPDGPWDVIWESKDDTPYDVAIEADASVLIGTGSGGKIFRVSGAPSRPALVSRADAQQVTMFLKDGAGRVTYATANPGKVFRLSTGYAERGHYESEVRDAKTVATWGTLNWRASVPASAHIEIVTRSGNTKAPDDTWSAWSEPYTNSDGSAITSPKARYLQWKAELSGKGASPVLTSVTVAYLQRNTRPEVTSVTVHPPGTVFQKPFSTGELEIAGFSDTLPDRRGSTSQQSAAAAMPTTGGPVLGRRIYQKGLQTFVWKAEDENDDDLQYDVFYRREGETSWKPLKRDLSDPILVWDTTSVPNGTYLIKVAASDSPSNPPGNALIGELESTTFDIDNTPPEISVTSSRRDGARSILAFEVRDDQSSIQRVEYSLDADRWRTTYPKDGIADSRVEQFELTLDADLAAKGVIIRAIDAMNNISTARGEVSMPKSRD